MKVGEFYKHKWNKYVSKITKITRKEVELVTLNSGVSETILSDNFSLNYEPVQTIYDFRKDLSEAFNFGIIKLMGDTVRVDVDESRLEFSIEDDRLKVSFTDDIKEAVESQTNILRFLIEDANDVISMFANLFE